MKKANNLSTQLSRKGPVKKKKSKTKSKEKSKTFNPLDYLNYLIEQIHDQKFMTTKKKLSTKRDNHSALGNVTSISERAFSGMKNRSKSSYSNRRKSVNLKSALQIDLDNYITEEDNMIQFTEDSVQQKITEDRKQLKQLDKNHFILTEQKAATKIQRAWRNYQTLKVVRKYYEYYKNLKRKEKRKIIEREVQNFGLVFESSKEFERTLKIKKEYSKETPEKSIQIHNKTLKLPCISLGENEIYETPTQQLNQDSNSQNLKHFQAQNECNSKDLKFIMNLFHESQEHISKEFSENIDYLYKNSQQLSKYDIDQEQSDQTVKVQYQKQENFVFKQMEQTLQQKYNLLIDLNERQLQKEKRVQKKQQLKARYNREKRGLEHFQQQYDFNNQKFKDYLLNLQKNIISINKISKNNYKETREYGPLRKCFSTDCIITKTIVDEISLRNKKQIKDFSVFSINFWDLRATNQKSKMLQNFEEKNHEFQKDNIMEIPDHQIEKKSNSPASPPTSPPSSNIMIYQNESNSFVCVDQQIDQNKKIKEQIYNSSNISDQLLLSEYKTSEINEFSQPFNSDRKSSELQFLPSESEELKQNNLMKLRQFSESLQEEIEQQILKEFYSEVFESEKLYTCLKVYIQDIYEFKKVSDQELKQFVLEKIPIYFESENIMLQKFNQKINPNSLEILRLIRDYDFEIEQYELIIPEDIFKLYRKDLEESYTKKIENIKEKIIKVDIKGITDGARMKIVQKQLEKKGKVTRYIAFQRDLKIMYLKSVFNCLNELIIEAKSVQNNMMSRSSIGPGELKLAIKQYNIMSTVQSSKRLISQCQKKIIKIIENKCMIPVFKNERQVIDFQRQLDNLIIREMDENEYKWVNYMDQTLQLWLDVSQFIYQTVLDEEMLNIRYLDH